MKRGESGLSMVLGVAKPSGITSHDVVSQVRRIFGERRVGHAGTLDPFASGVLPIMVGPATRLDKYMTAHDKTYVADIAFGKSTTTDDRCGEVTLKGSVPEQVGSMDFASRTLDAFVGKSMQMPPAYSAIKVDGKKACDEARRGNVIKLEPRPIEVYSAQLMGISEAGGEMVWRVAFHVSKGTYIRALARDIGKRIGVPAHLAELERRSVGCIRIEDCTPLDDLDAVREGAAIDPVKMLDFLVAFVGAEEGSRVGNGGTIDAAGMRLFSCSEHIASFGCDCTPTFTESGRELVDGELVSVVCDNKLIAIYRFDAKSGLMKPDCVFSTGVRRGADILA